jgi:hypothetical protein
VGDIFVLFSGVLRRSGESVGAIFVMFFWGFAEEWWVCE